MIVYKGDNIKFNFDITISVKASFDFDQHDVEMYIESCLRNYILAKQEEFNK